MIIYKIEFKKQAKKFIKKHQFHIKTRFDKWIKKLIKTTHTENDGIVKNLFYDERQVYKKRIGNIRIFYIIYETEIKILITDAGNKGQIYKK